MKLKGKKNKKKIPSNNTRKLLILTLLASNCLEKSEDENLIASTKAKRVINNTIHLASNLHPKEELDKLYEFLIEVIKKSKYNEQFITVEQAFVFSMLTIDAHKLKLFFGMSRFDEGDYVEFGSKEVAVWLDFLKELDEFCNTKPYVSKVNLEISTKIAKRKINKKKKTRTTSQSNKTPSNTMKLSSSKRKYIEKKEKARKAIRKFKILAFKNKVKDFMKDHADSFYIAYEPHENTKDIVIIEDNIDDFHYWLWFLKEDIRYSCDWKLLTKKRVDEIQKILKEISSEIKELW